MSKPRALSTGLSFLVIAIGAIGLAGWVFGISTFKTVFPGLVTMKANTAVCLILLGSTLWMLQRQDAKFSRRFLASVFPAMVILIAALTFTEHLFHWDIGIDHILFTESVAEAGQSFPGRMGPATCLSFMLIGSALILLDYRARRGFWPAPYLATASMPIIFLAFLAYFYGAQPISALTQYISIALHTVIALFALDVGILLARPEREFVPSFIGQRPGAILARRLLPAALMLPALLGWLSVLARNANLYGVHYGTALVVCALTVIFSALIWITAGGINHLDEQRLRGEEELRRTVDFSTAVMTNMGEGLYTVDSQGLVTFMNPAAEKLFGWTFEELRGKKMHEMTHYKRPDGTPFPASECAGLQVLKGGEVLSGFEDVFIRKDGSFFPVTYSSAPLREQNSVTGLVVVFRDISERRKAERALQESEAVLRTVTNEAQVGLVMVNKERRYLFANNAYAQILGLPGPNIVGQRIADVLASVYDEQIKPRLDRAFAGERITYELRLPSHPKKESPSYYEVIYEPRISGPEEPYVIVVLVDITERKLIQETLERTVAERTASLRQTVGELEAFSYSISHDMRAPLRAMTAYAEVLAEDFANELPATARNHLNSIRSAAVRMDQLITDVLAYSRISRGERAPEPIDLEPFVTEIISHYPVLQPPNAEIQIQPPLPKVLGDQASLGQCISNLLTNAVKFVAPGVRPLVKIYAEKHQHNLTTNEPQKTLSSEHESAEDSFSTKQFIRIWFEDNGIGIRPEDTRRIFGIFERVHSNATYEGTGIGLAIVKKAVERMGGQTGVESAPGKGSRFWLELELADKAP